MKINVFILKYGLIVCALTVMSCDKQETETNIPKEAVLEEGFKSTTSNSDSEIEVSSQEPLSPFLNMSYDASLSEKETSAKFQTEVSKLKKEEGQTNKGRKAVYYTIRTRTGAGPHNETDGRVRAWVTFESDTQQYADYIVLNNSGDDRESGQWDYYLFRLVIESADKWVEAKSAMISLTGTDGWYVSHFYVIINKSYQTLAGFSYSRLEGGSTIETTPRIWLDNNTSVGESGYRTGWIGEGRLKYKWPYFY